ncbi:hypothetical protein OJ996_07465 [Luteolibacter sp. GHJ8]|uniref:Uncharacterized protein n=1 Tax=Luteolibacter rhizosphaerae TaxID=2989719 RepID=A0ABT3G0N7_9BACT|nr:hypothetical protein [Luteolibacter rhizosphaerae]MCW1913405.1 hypothetical protein [Luteolibacter rhizosphaerae]
MSIPSKVQFNPRWKEELVCMMDGRQFIIEMTMGVYTAYLPSEAKWEQAAPEWAAGQWERVRADAAAWCEGQKMPLVIEDRAWIHFE